MRKNLNLLTILFMSGILASCGDPVKATTVTATEATTVEATVEAATVEETTVEETSIEESSEEVSSAEETTEEATSKVEVVVPKPVDVINAIGKVLLGEDDTAIADGDAYYLAVGFGDLSANGFTDKTFLQYLENKNSNLYLVPEGFIAYGNVDQDDAFSDGTSVCYSDYVFDTTADETITETTLLELVTYHITTYNEVVDLTAFESGVIYYTLNEESGEYTAVNVDEVTEPADGVTYYTASTNFILQAYSAMTDVE